tara:strand:- start:318 stop:995 length:678 start_codon:yes stop_codon:yes gene_type:complete
MIKKEEIYEACKNKINQFKNLDNEDFIAAEPLIAWIQTDPENLKAKGIIKDVKFLTNSILECENINKQKKKIKEIIFNEELTASSLVPILLFPDPKNLEKLNYYPHKNINDKNYSNYVRWLISKEPFITIGITEEKSIFNAAVICKKYSTSRIISSVFQEILKNLGVSEIWDRANSLFKDSTQNILKIIPLISDDGVLDDSKLSDEYKFFLQLKAYVDNAFLEDD